MARVVATEFVGRTAEVARLQRCLDLATAGGAVPLVLLTGDAGVGKTRCLAAFLESARGAGATVLLGGCLPLSGGELPYAPMAEALRGLLRTAGPERMAQWLGEQAAVLARLVPELVPTGPAIVSGPPGASVLGATGEAGPIFSALLAVFERMTVQAPVVLAVEDVHWADRASRDLLSLLLRATAEQRMLIVLTCRTDELPPADPVLAWLADLDRVRPTDRVELGQLSRRELDTLLGSVLGAPPDRRLADRIYALSGGNAFFAEELLAVQPNGAGLPDTVRDTVLCRVGALPEPAQRLVRTAAVAAASGPEVPHELLAAVLGWPDTDLVAAARSAVTMHLLTGTSRGYGFRHALTREAVETDLLPVEMTLLHAKIARVLEEKGDTVADPVAAARLAYHWYAARQLPEALAAAVAAGTAASAAFAFHIAADLLERAIELWPQVPDAQAVAGVDEAALYERAADAIYRGQHGGRAEDLARRALAAIDETAQPERAARLHLLAGVARWAYCADSMAALHEAGTAAALLPADSPVLADALAAQARFSMLLERHADAVSAAESAIARAEAVGAPAAKASALVSLGVALAELGDDRAAMEAVLAGRRLAEALSDGITVGRSYVNAAGCYERSGRFIEMVDEAVSGVAATVRFGVDQTIGMVLRAMVASRMVDAGRWDEADRYSAQAIAAEGNPRLWAMHARAELDTARGDLDAAQAVVDKLLPLADVSSEPQIVEPAYAAAAELALRRGEVKAARGLVAAGLDGVNRHGGNFSTHRLVWLGWRTEADAAATGQPADSAAVDRLRAADTPARGPLHPGYQALARAEMARLDGASDPQLWDAAAAIWDGIGATYLAGYPTLRAAEAAVARGDRALAARRLSAVRQIADDLKAAPLLAAVADLGRRARIAVDHPRPHTELPHGLTEREAAVLKLIAAGLTNRDIARQLFISEHTVGVHVSHVLAKLGVARRTEAVGAAHRLGLVSGC
jgi:DNA-binding CsgD family transcriptional regulator/tetratricopeptide (TPR) repeat protein